MNRLVRIFLLLFALVSSLRAAGQTSYSIETSNNTSACPVSGAQNGCTSNFGGLTDHYRVNDASHPFDPTKSPGPATTPPASNTQTQTTVAPASNISLIPFNTLLYPGFSGNITTKIVCHLVPWFGATNHINIGMNMKNTVAEQAQNAIARGCNYVGIDWFGPNRFEDSVTALWLTQLDSLCQQNGGVCPLQMAIMEDISTGTGATINGFENDLKNTIFPNYMTGHPSYWTMTVAGCTDRPLLLSFGWLTSVLSTDSEWGMVKTFIHSSTGLNKQCTGEPLLLAEGQAGIAAFTNLDGAFNWIGPDPYWSATTSLPDGCSTCDVADSSGHTPGSVTSIGLSGTVQYNPHLLAGSGSFAVDSWYNNALANPSTRVLIGSAYAGFDDTNADWGWAPAHINGRKIAQQCGRVWLNSWKRLTAAGFSASNQIGFVGIPTWNDYEEGTAIETGIDNCVNDSALTLTLNGSTLSWEISFTDATFGTSETIHHFTLFDGADSQGNSMAVHTDNISLQQANCQPVAQSNSISCSIDVNTLGTWSVGTHFLFVKAVGQPSIKNHLSTRPGPAYGVTSSSLTPPSQNFGSAAVGQIGATQSFTFQNTGSAALQVNSVTIAGDFSSRDGSAAACQRILAGGESCTINATFVPTQAGSRTGSLTVNSTSTASPNVATLTGTGATGTAGATLSPTSLAFGNQIVGTTASPQAVTLTNSGTVQLSVGSIAATGDFAAISNNCPAVLSANTSCTINVNFTPTVMGSRSGLLTVTDNAASSPQQVSLSGTGTPGLRFVPVSECRIADTRNPNGPFGGPFLTAGASARAFNIPSSACNIPAEAQAYSLNVTVVPHAQPVGFLTLFPCGQAQPATSTLNSVDGRVKAAAAIVGAGTAGGVCAFATGDTDLILDINGYFVPASNTTALAYYPVTPCRLVDTRGAAGPLSGPSLVANAARTFPLVSGACQLPATAQAYSLNFTAIPPGALGFVTAWPAGQAQPPVSTLNAPTGVTTANAAIVPAGTNGAISVFASNNTDLVIDVNGYFAAPGVGGLSLFTLPPCRVLDTRNPAGSPPFSGTLTINVGVSSCGAPSSAQAYVLNATVVPSGPLGFLTLWPADGSPQPATSTLNAPDGVVTSNMAIVPTNNGSIKAFASSTTHLVVDIFGYFAE